MPKPVAARKAAGIARLYTLGPLSAAAAEAFGAGARISNRTPHSPTRCAPTRSCERATCACW